MRSLVLIDHDGGQIRKPSRSAIAAAQRLGGEVDLLVAGEGVAPVAEAAARLPGIAKVLVADSPALAGLLAEQLAALLRALASFYTHLLAPATQLGKNVLPRLAALLDVQLIGEVAGIRDADTFVRPVYSGAALATVRSADAVKVLTIRAASFDPVAEEGGAAAVQPVAVEIPPPERVRFVGREIARSERPELTAARIVVAGGRGLGAAENFRLIDAVADRLGAAVGATRAAVDAGYVPNDCQIGQTGKIVAPELYIAVGISGAIQHLAGMKDSKVIVAVNKDEEAPIFQVADYGLVADLFQALPELAAELDKPA